MSRWILSVDLGQSIDPTALAVLKITTRRDAVDLSLVDPPRHAVPLSWFNTGMNGNGQLRDPDGAAHIDVVHLERFPLKTSYVDIVSHVGSILGRPELPPSTELLIDQSGVGRPVVDLFRAQGMRPIGVTITGGSSETQKPHPEQDDWLVAKLLLVSRLQSALHAGQLRIAEALPEAKTLALELQDFRATIAESGFVRFGARIGRHDDLVLALAIGCWWGTRKKTGGFQQGHYVG